MLAVIASSLGLVLRTARTAWDTQDSDYAAMHHAQSVAMHFVRQAREGRKIQAISSSKNSITLELRDGSTIAWSHLPSGMNGRPNAIAVDYSASGTRSPLAYGIRNLSFSGFEADGRTPTIVPNEIRLVRVDVTVDVPNNAQTQQTFSSMVWIRSW